MKWTTVLFFAGWIVGTGHSVGAQSLPDDVIVNGVTVDGKNIPVTQNRSLNLGALPTNILFHFGASTNLHYPGARIHYKLDGYDAGWHSGHGYMFVVVTFYNEARDEISREEFRVTGDSAGWDGSPESSTLTHRHEMIMVPPRASRMIVVVSSAGPRAAIGFYAVANLKVAKIQGNAAPMTLLKFPPDHDWIRDGNIPSLARIMTVGHSPPQKALAVLDNNPAGGAGWHNTWASAQIVNPGDQMALDWDEMFSLGVADLNVAPYDQLPEGHFLFHVGEFDLFGKPTGKESVLDVLVPPPYWQQPWFWPLCAFFAAAAAFGNWRYLVWRRVRSEMSRLKNQQALEKERLRIARDIHDDLGARITEISLASALAKTSAASLEAACADFDHISDLSRELIAALYETVWAVNPANDNLDSLGTYLCQITDHLCKQAKLPCRLEMDELPHNVQVSSQIRHNIAMVLKEAAHNAVKHARASEIILRMTYQEPELTVGLSDNGVGFKTDGPESSAGHGLRNMQDRLAAIGAQCHIESRPDQGTSIQMRIKL